MPRKFTCSSCCWALWKRQDDDDEETRHFEEKFGIRKTSVIQKDNFAKSTGNPRNKVALQPGHSLMDWIRLGASGKDLTGVGIKAGHLAVTKLELARHNKIDDIWVAIRGKVYNLTVYVPFHPGGPDELMRAAGIDATRLFDQVHPWVNYDQILQKCFIGRLVSVDPSQIPDDLFFNKPSSPLQSPAKQFNRKKVLAESQSTTKEFPKGSSSEAQVNKVEQPTALADSSKVAGASSDVVKDVTEELNSRIPVLPRFDWIQKLDTINVIFYTRAFSNPMVEIYPPNSNKAITVTLTYDDTSFQNELVFYEDIEWPCLTKVSCETGKVEMTFRKKESRVWENYGRLRQQSSEVEAANVAAKYNFVYKNKSQVTHNIFLLELEKSGGVKIVVPVGKHVRAFVNVDGVECSRSYTPVPKFLFSSNLPTHAPTTDAVCLMIKSYENGKVSSYLTARENGDMIYLTNPTGDVDLMRVEKREIFLLLAAGTGITPMFGLLLFLLERRIKKCQFLRLMFFNRTERDIPFREQLDNLSDSDPRLKVDHILSQPDENWTGLKGHINKEMLENSILEHIKDTGYTIRDVFTFVCGPTMFLTLAVEELIKLEFLNEQIHVFQG